MNRGRPSYNSPKNRVVRVGFGGAIMAEWSTSVVCMHTYSRALCIVGPYSHSLARDIERRTSTYEFHATFTNEIDSNVDNQLFRLL